MEIFAGFILCICLELLGWLTWWVWQKSTRVEAPPQRPQTPSQQANLAVFEDHQAQHPRVVQMPMQRRNRRRRPPAEVEDYNQFFDE